MKLEWAFNVGESRSSLATAPMLTYETVILITGLFFFGAGTYASIQSILDSCECSALFRSLRLGLSPLVLQMPRVPLRPPSSAQILVRSTCLVASALGTSRRRSRLRRAVSESDAELTRFPSPGFTFNR